MMLTSKASVLLVEDDAHKLSALLEFFDADFPDFNVQIARSVNGAAVLISECNFNLAVIDMSLPGYDILPGRRVGVPEGFGGEDILRLIQDDHPLMYMVVVTQLSEFSDKESQLTKSLKDLTLELSTDLGEKYLGLVSYSGRYASWRDELRNLIQPLTRGLI